MRERRLRSALLRWLAIAVLVAAAAAGSARAQSDTFQFSSGTINGSTLTLTFSHDLRTSPKPAASLFSIWSSETYGTPSVTNVVVSGKTLTLTLNEAVPSGEGALVYHCFEQTACSSDPVTSSSGQTIAAGVEFTPISLPPVAFSHAVVNGYGIVLHFDGDLVTSQTPAISAFSISGFSATLLGLALTASEAHKVELFVSPPVPNGTRPDITYTPPATNPLTSALMRGNVAAFRISDSTADNSYQDPGPVVRSITASGDTLTLAFDAALAAPATLTAADFSVCSSEPVSGNSGCANASSFTVSGANVALEFAAGTLATGTKLWLYHAPSQNSDKLYAAADSSRKVEPIERHPFTLSAAVAPSRSSITADGASVSITFSAALDASNAPTTGAFTVTGKSITAATVSGSIVTLTVSPAFSDGETATLGYDAATGNLVGANGLAVASWTGAAVVNETDAAPTLSSQRSSTDGGEIALAFNEALDAAAATGVPAASAFTLTSGSSAVTAVAVSGTTATLTVSPPLVEGASAALAYAQPSGASAAKLRDADQGNLPVAAFNVAVDNRTDTAPALVSAAVNGAALALTFDQALSTSNTPAASAFAVTVAGSSAAVSAVSLSGSAATLTLGSAVAHNQAVTVSYTAPGSGGLQDATGNAVASISSTSVANNTPVPLPALDGATVDGAAVSLSFDGNLETNSSLAASAFTFTPAQTISAASASGAKVSITLGAAIAEGASLSVAYAPPGTASTGIRAADGRSIAAFSQSLTNDTDTAPVLSTSAVNGATLTLTFDQALSAAEPAASAFSATVAGSARTVSGVQVSGSSVILMLASAVGHGEAVTLSYAPPSSSPLADGTGNNVAAFGPVSVANNTPAPLPTVSSGAVNGTAVTLTFSGNLTDSTTVATSAFTFTPANTVSSVNVSGKTIAIVLGTAAAEGAALSVAYAQPAMAAARLLAADGRAVAAFNSALVNHTDTAPVLNRATVNGAKLTLTFDQALGHATEPAATAFSVAVAGTSTSVSTVASSGSNTVLTLASAVLPGQAVTVAYTKPAANPLGDATGNDVASFAAISAANLTLPSVTSASVDGSTVTIAFSGPLKADASLTTARFTLFPSYTVSAASASGSTVTLTLSEAVPEDVTFTLEYNVSTSAARPLRATGGAAVEGFLINLPNNTDTVPAILSIVAAIDTITVSFDQALDLTAVPTASQFTASGTASEIWRVLIDNSGTSGRGVLTLSVRPDVRELDVVKLSYAKAMATNIRDPEGNELAAFSNSAVTNITDTPPVISSAAVTGSNLTIVFDQDMEAVSAVRASHFTLGGTSAGVSSGALANNSDGVGELALVLDAAVHELDTVTISYSPPNRISTDDIRDAEGHRAAFSAHSVSNLTDTAPVVKTAVGDGSTIEITFDQPVSLSGAVKDAMALTTPMVTVPVVTVSSVSATGAVVTLLLDAPLKEIEQSAMLTFTPSATVNIVDGTGNVAAGFSIPVDNQTDTTPVLEGDIVGDETTITITFDQPLALRTVTPDGFSLEPFIKLRQNTILSGSTLTLTTIKALREGQAYTLTYAPPATAQLEDPSGNLVAGFSANIDNQTDVGPMFVGGTVIGQQVELRFDQDIALTGMPAEWLNIPLEPSSSDPQLRICKGLVLLDDSDQPLNVDPSKVVASGNVLTLTLALPEDAMLEDAIAPTDSVSACYKPVSGHGVTDVQPEPVPGEESEQPNELMEIDPKALASTLRNLTVSATADGRVLEIRFAEALRAVAEPARGISVTVDGVGVEIESMVLAGGKLLRGELAREIEEDEVVRVAYEAASGGLRYDLDGLAVADFDIEAKNRSDTPAVPLAATLSGTRLVIRFSRELDPAHPPAAASFAVHGAPGVLAVDSVSGYRLVLELRSAANGPRTGTSISYRPSRAEEFPDASGTAVAGFERFPVEDIGPEPRPVSAVGDGRWLVVRFDRGLDEARKPPRTAWFVMSTSEVTVERVVQVSEFEVELQLAEPGLRDREGAFVVYAGNLPYRVKLRGWDGRQAPSFVLPIVNATENPPLISSVVARRRFVQLQFDQMMRTAAAVEDFAVSIGGRPAVVSRLHWAGQGRVLTLLFDREVAAGDEVRVRYAGAARLHDLSGRPLAALDETADNRVRRPRSAGASG